MTAGRSVRYTSNRETTRGQTASRPLSGLVHCRASAHDKFCSSIPKEKTHEHKTSNVLDGCSRLAGPLKPGELRSPFRAWGQSNPSSYRLFRYCGGGPWLDRRQQPLESQTLGHDPDHHRLGVQPPLFGPWRIGGSKSRAAGSCRSVCSAICCSYCPRGTPLGAPGLYS